MSASVYGSATNGDDPIVHIEPAASSAPPSDTTPIPTDDDTPIPTDPIQFFLPSDFPIKYRPSLPHATNPSQAEPTGTYPSPALTAKHSTRNTTTTATAAGRAAVTAAVTAIQRARGAAADQVTSWTNPAAKTLSSALQAGMPRRNSSTLSMLASMAQSLQDGEGVGDVHQTQGDSNAENDSSSANNSDTAGTDSSTTAGTSDARSTTGTSGWRRPILATRIIGGTNVPKGRFPFVASLRDQQGNHFCGGTLILPRVVMTAAHCLDQANPGLKYPLVSIGRFYNTLVDATSNIVNTRCINSIVHEGWSFTSGRDDVALCILAQAVQTIQPVAIATQTLTDPNQAMSVLGWGANREGGGNSETLQMAQVYKMDSTTCNKTYSGRVSDTQQICAGLALGGADACQGDSGGPLLLVGDQLGDDMQEGIVSWGSGCGEAGKPGVYTNVPYYRDWINLQLQNYLGTQLPDSTTQQPTDNGQSSYAYGTNTQQSATDNNAQQTTGGSGDGTEPAPQQQQQSQQQAGSTLLDQWANVLAKLWG